MKTASGRASLLQFAAAVAVILAGLWFAMRPNETRSRPTVVSESGNVVAIWPDGRRVRLTNSGKDAGPSLSPDGAEVAFRRATEGQLVFAGSGEEEANELWIVDVNGANPRMVLRGEDRNDRHGSWDCDLITAGFFDLQFSPDGKQIFFTGPCAVTSALLHVVDVTTGRARGVCSSQGGHVVLYDGPFVGSVIVQQRRYHVAGGAFTWCYLVDPSGQKIATLGDCDSLEDRESRRKLFDDWLRDGQVSPPTPE